MSLQKYLLWIKDILMKKEYDFDRPDPDLFNFHPQVTVILAMQGIFYGQRDSYVRFIWPFLCINLSLVGVAFEMMFVIYGIGADISFAIECFCYLVILGVIPIVCIGLLPNKTKILDMLDDINADFHNICGLGPEYRNLFLERQLLIWMLCIAWFALCAVTGLMFVMFPVVVLLYQTIFVTQDEHTIRPLVFPMWLPKDDPYRTPNYEIFMFLEMCFCGIYIQGFCGYVYLLFHFLIHYLTLMDMIILDFQVLFEGLDPAVATLPTNHPRKVEVKQILRKRIGRIVKWHQSVFKAISTISSMFGPPLAYQLMFSSTVLCLIAFQVAKSLDEGGLDVLFVMLGICGCIQLWIPCYLGTLLRNKGFAIGDSCFYCGWNETPLGPMIRNELCVIIFRAQIPIYIKFTGLPNIQLETYSSVMSSSYSYFNMLRQYSSD